MQFSKCGLSPDPQISGSLQALAVLHLFVIMDKACLSNQAAFSKRQGLLVLSLLSLWHMAQCLSDMW